MEIKRFAQYNESKKDVLEPLSDDIELIEVEGEDGENFDFKEFEIESVIDVIVADDMEYGNELVEAMISTHADVSKKATKRGDTLYITALLRKKDTTSFNSPAVQGVLKVRVVDIYYGLQYLNKVVN